MNAYSVVALLLARPKQGGPSKKGYRSIAIDQRSGFSRKVAVVDGPAISPRQSGVDEPVPCHCCWFSRPLACFGNKAGTEEVSKQIKKKRPA